MKTILIATTGMTPAVLTETVWALAQKPRARGGISLEPVIPDEVFVITTISGRAKLEEQLLAPPLIPTGGDEAPPLREYRSSPILVPPILVPPILASPILVPPILVPPILASPILVPAGLRPCGGASSPSVWDALRTAILGEATATDNRLCFGPTNIIVACKKQGGKKIPLDALADTADHTAFADTIMDELWKHTSKPDTRVIASLAGGFKTMSALMLSTMQLLANPGDRMTHVLVSGGLDKPNSGFFFPTTKEQAKHVHLIDIPLIPLRRWFADLNRKPASYESLVNDSLKAISNRTEDIRIELADTNAFPHWIKINNAKSDLTPLQYSYLRFFAEQAKKGCPAYTCVKEIDPPFRAWVAKNISGIEANDIDADKINKRISNLRHDFPALARVLPSRDKWNLTIPPANIILH